MRIIIDPSILLTLEAQKIIAEEYSSLFSYATSQDCQVLIHPDCKAEILRGKDSHDRDIIKSKFKKYKELSSPALLTEEFSQMVGQKNQDERIANQQLIQIYRGYAELFITEDQEIIKKAGKIGCEEKVLSIKDGLIYLKKIFEYTAPHHPIIKNCSVRKIEHLLPLSFFDSLRADYPNFDLWFEQCLKEDRQCYYLTVEEKLSAILIYNIEPAEKHKIPNIFEKALKMCTFKTGDNALGLKMGELFLSKMFQMCVEKNIQYLYITSFEKQFLLIPLLLKFGFEKKDFQKNGEEILFLKTFDKDDFSSDKLNKISCHPFYSDSSRFQKFVVPIQPKFYNTLFKDSSLRQRTLFDGQFDSLNEIEGNSIEKAYICGAKTKKLKPGDILLFYSSQEHKMIQPIGILDKCYYSVDSLKKLKSRVRGKTVYNEDELEKLFNDSSGKVTVIIFRLLYYLKTPIEMQTLKELNCFSANFVTITQMPEVEYQKLKQEGRFDERYIVNQT
ncbi:MAG TPA: hypothetical protein VK469_19975 [Candidatus Kapabacteria bacterium]|nr:hypothetical protein [Candidatus Kapabacteria bacterium]